MEPEEKEKFIEMLEVRMKSLEKLLSDLYKPLVCEYEILDVENKPNDIEIKIVCKSEVSYQSIGMVVAVSLLESRNRIENWATILDRYCREFHNSFEKKLVREGIQSIYYGRQ